MATLLDRLPRADLDLILARPDRPAGDPSTWTGTDLTRLWCAATGTPFVPFSADRVDLTVLSDASVRPHCDRHGWLPLFGYRALLVVVTPAPFDPTLRRELAKWAHAEVHLVGCAEEDFFRAKAELPLPAERVSLVAQAEAAAMTRRPTSWYPPGPPVRDHREVVLNLLRAAHRLGASEVFLEDYGPGQIVDVRFRIVAAAEVLPPIPPEHRPAFLTELKGYFALAVTDRAEPRDSRATLRLESGAQVDLRAAFAPTERGEAAAIRLLDRNKLAVLAQELPFPDALKRVALWTLRQREGLVLFSGPTGSGKTTSLYAMLLQLDRNDLVLRSAEDPVEYSVRGISQMPVGAHLGRTFADALRAFLRMAPDVIALGEIRGADAARQAATAAQTGHLVLSSVHAQDAVGVILRLLDLDVSPLLLRGTARLFVAQRMVDTLCTHCREELPPDAFAQSYFAAYGLPVPGAISRARGCVRCGYMGYAGRRPLYEWIHFRRELADLIFSPFDEARFRARWHAGGGRTLGHAALAAAAAGEVAFEDALRFDSLGVALTELSGGHGP